MEINQNPPETPQPTPPQTPEPAPINPTPPVIPQPTISQGGFKAFISENKWAMGVIGVSLLFLVVASFFAFRKPKNDAPVQPKVDISIDAPQSISSGNEIIYKMHVQNNDKETIKNIVVDLNYPNGFVYEDATPKPTKLSGTEFALPSMDPGQDANVMIKGTIQGNAGETKVIKAVMHYKYSTVTSDYVATTEAQTQITTANVSLQFSGKTDINANQETTYQLEFANFTDKQISNFKITMTVPNAFIVSSANPKPNLGYTWNLGNLDPNGNGKITLTGTFKDASVGDQELFTATAEGSVDGKPSFALSSGQLQVTIAQVPLEAQVTLSGHSDGTVKPGDNLSYLVDYRNNGSDIAHGVSITVHLDGEALDMNSISASNATINGSTISWDASQNNDLETVGAGDGGQFTFNVSVNDPATRSTSKNLTVSARAEIINSDFNQPFIGKTSIAKVATVVALTKTITHLSGPLPPTVGQASSYMIEIGIKNETNDITDGKMTMSLPSSASFDLNSVNSAEKANVSYDKSTKKLTWTVDKVVAHAGRFVPQRKLQFTVTFTPTNASRGSNVTMASNIKFDATDNFTALPVSLTLDPVTTNDDPSQQGVVQ
jgi:hypothetical protein